MVIMRMMVFCRLGSPYLEDAAAPGSAARVPN